MGFFSSLINGIRSRTTFIMGSGTYNSPRRVDIEKSDQVSAIIDCNASHIAKGSVLHVLRDSDGRIKEVKRSSPYTKIFRRPNSLMTGVDFMYAMAWQLQVANTAIAWVKWDDKMRAPAEIWPITYLSTEIRQTPDGQYCLAIMDDGGTQIVPIEDLIILRRRYDGSGYASGDNTAVLDTLSTMSTIDEGLRDAVTISNKIHGLLVQKNAMLAPKDVKKSQDEFIARMKEAAKTGGIVALDGTEDYKNLDVRSYNTPADVMSQVEKRVYTYWRTPQSVVDNTATEQVMQNYYDSVVEVVWLAMEQAFTDALFTRREQDFGNALVVTSGAATGASWQTKLSIISDTKDVGLLSPNEYRELLGYAPVEGGDERLVSLNFVKASEQSKYQTGADAPAEPDKEDEDVTDN